jgi:hypothetical protein
MWKRIINILSLIVFIINIVGLICYQELDLTYIILICYTLGNFLLMVFIFLTWYKSLIDWNNLLIAGFIFKTLSLGLSIPLIIFNKGESSIMLRIILLICFIYESIIIIGIIVFYIVICIRRERSSVSPHTIVRSFSRRSLNAFTTTSQDDSNSNISSLNFTHKPNISFSLEKDIIKDVIDKDIPICSICLTNSVNIITKTPCNHLYHKNCLSDWLKINNSCPLCKKAILLQDYERLSLDEVEKEIDAANEA